MISAALMLFANTLLFSLRLDRSGSFPRPLSASEERMWLERLAQGDPDARNVLIERHRSLPASHVEHRCLTVGKQVLRCSVILVIKTGLEYSCRSGVCQKLCRLREQWIREIAVCNRIRDCACRGLCNPHHQILHIACQYPAVAAVHGYRNDARRIDLIRKC